MNLQLSAPTPIVNCGGANGLHVELLLQKFAFGLQIFDSPFHGPTKFQFGFADFMYVCIVVVTSHFFCMFVCGSFLLKFNG